MPAAAVIPAPTAYTNIVAVKTLVVQCRAQGCGVEGWSSDLPSCLMDPSQIAPALALRGNSIIGIGQCPLVDVSLTGH